MPEKHTEIVKLHEVVRTIPSHQQLMKVNRVLMGVVLFLMLAVFAFGLFLVPDPNLVQGHNKLSATAIAADGMNPAVSSEVNALKGQLIGLVSGSIESKLRTLETSIKSGKVDNSLGTIADLKNDIKVLRSYSETPKKQNLAVSNQDLAQEVTHLKHLIYATIASCGLMFVAAAGVWVKYRKRLPYKDIKKGFLGKY